ncbi:uncharacterized protein LOC113522105 [Galleria mellonella]|uniref:Uncharacterized protein LOC113522105 n=1 Tax=Galleria mellonella TaxID=7137 RepID=A0ABM3MKW7_GALME|nr:uncharacterized protein LOC113522105 [Galleria mellonella]
MPKRKNSDNDLDNISKKLKKLEKKLKRARRHRNSDNSDKSSPHSISSPDAQTCKYRLRDFLDNSSSPKLDTTPPQSKNLEEITPILLCETNQTGDLAAMPPAEIEIATHNEEDNVAESGALDSIALDILGEDPTSITEYGSDIHKELANRLEHIATDGLTKETRKELCSKYLVPANSKKIGAPLVNAEIKAALSEATIKRDKGIETRQKQLAAAISGLSGILNQELNSKDKDSSRLKIIMDVTRILCDIQHAESVTRRYLAMGTIKKDLREHLTNTKIDKYLFGENLSETLKTAKLVTKSGTDLKIKSQPRPKPQNPTGNLNYRAPVPVRRQQQGPQRSRGPASRMTTSQPNRYSQNPTHSNLSKPSQHPQKPAGRR